MAVHTCNIHCYSQNLCKVKGGEIKPKAIHLYKVGAFNMMVVQVLVRVSSRKKGLGGGGKLDMVGGHV